MVGDVNQLPSVGPGNVLKDMIKSEFCKCSKTGAGYSDRQRRARL